MLVFSRLEELVRYEGSFFESQFCVGVRGGRRGRARDLGQGLGLGLSKALAAEKGVGKSGAKRHRGVIRDNIRGITSPAIRRLARRGGVKRARARRCCLHHGDANPSRRHRPVARQESKKWADATPPHPRVRMKGSTSQNIDEQAVPRG